MEPFLLASLRTIEARAVMPVGAPRQLFVFDDWMTWDASIAAACLAAREPVPAGLAELVLEIAS